MEDLHHDISIQKATQLFSFIELMSVTLSPLHKATCVLLCAPLLCECQGWAPMVYSWRGGRMPGGLFLGLQGQGGWDSMNDNRWCEAWPSSFLFSLLIFYFYMLKGHFLSLYSFFFIPYTLLCFILKTYRCLISHLTAVLTVLQLTPCFLWAATLKSNYIWRRQWWGKKTLDDLPLVLCLWASSSDRSSWTKR